MTADPQVVAEAALVRANAVLNSYGIRGQLWHDLNAILAPVLAALAHADTPGASWVCPHDPECGDQCTGVVAVRRCPAGHSPNADGSPCCTTAAAVWSSADTPGVVGADERALRWVDKTTGEPCPARGALTCTITDKDHRHVARHMVARASGAGETGLRARLTSLADEWDATVYKLPPGYPMTVNEFCRYWFKAPLRAALAEVRATTEAGR